MRHIPEWLQESLKVGACFGLVYWGANFITGLHSFRIPLHFQWELGLPFVPQLSSVYLSIGPAMTLVAWALRKDNAALVRFRRVLVVEILTAGLLFILIPAELAPGFTRTSSGAWKPWMDACATVGLQYNLFPSLHVAFAFSTAGHAPRKSRPWFLLWATLVAASTLVLHLHHLLDVFAGVLLAWMVENRIRTSLPCPPATPSQPD